VPLPDSILIVFAFAFGCCIGSFLNVVVYRLPRDKSLVKPPSSCPSCGKHIRFYDNIPLLSWLLLLGKCRNCKAKISPRYFIIELLTGLVFAGLFVFMFRSGLRRGMVPFEQGGWIIYLASLALASGFIAASAIDIELWVIPISVCWFVTAVGIVASSVAGYVIDINAIQQFKLLPSASAATGALALGASAGLVISMILLGTGLVKRSYEEERGRKPPEAKQDGDGELLFNDRLEVCLELVFLIPIIACSIATFLVLTRMPTVYSWWVDFSQHTVVSGLLGSFWGYFIGCAIVWATRILGTLGFGKEAMGLGDVHLMGAAGAIIGPIPVVLAFFVAPFLGLLWVACQMTFKKTRQIPYGPFLSLGVFTVMILHDWIFQYLYWYRYH